MRKQCFLFSVIILFAILKASAINFSRINVAWQYDDEFSVKMNHRVVDMQKGVIVFLKVSSDSLSAWKYEFLLQDDYESEEHKAIRPNQTDTLLGTNNQVIIKLQFGDFDEKLLVVKFSQPESFYYYDISLAIGSLSYPSIYPIDEKGLPIFTNYINRKGHSWVGSHTYLAMRYKENFLEADPPMAEMKPLIPQVQADTALVFSNEVIFEEQFFYTVRKDSLANSGVTILRMPPYFPEYRQLGELIESMLYLTSEQEKKAMLRSNNPKQSFDSFWMNTYSTKSRARSAIRKYYNWVESANAFFTDFKPGWKTDRGMMYIVFGKPDEVYRTGNLEEWFYDDGAAFEFTIISTFFAPKTYTLRRNIEFEEQWFTQIAAIRRGIK